MAVMATTLGTALSYTPVSKARWWTGCVLSGFAMLFLLFDSVIKLVQIPAVTESFTQLGYPVSLALTIGLIEIACLILYTIPNTSVLGAIVLTGYFGGAIATHVRIGSPLATHTLFPIYVALMVWGGLFLRDIRLGALIPLRRS